MLRLPISAFNTPLTSPLIKVLPSYFTTSGVEKAITPAPTPAGREGNWVDVSTDVSDPQGMQRLTMSTGPPRYSSRPRSGLPPHIRLRTYPPLSCHIRAWPITSTPATHPPHSLRERPDLRRPFLRHYWLWKQHIGFLKTRTRQHGRDVWQYRQGGVSETIQDHTSHGAPHDGSMGLEPSWGVCSDKESGRGLGQESVCGAQWKHICGGDGACEGATAYLVKG